MKKFKVGDLVKGNSFHGYSITNANMTKGKVVKLYDSGCIVVKILEHETRPEEIGKTFWVSKDYFDLLPKEKTTVEKRMLKQKLVKEILHEPTAAEKKHERMRIKTLLFGGDSEKYMLRLTKITNAQKMYNTYKMLSSMHGVSKYGTKKAQLLEKALIIVIKYLKKNKFTKYISVFDKNWFKYTS